MPAVPLLSGLVAPQRAAAIPLDYTPLAPLGQLRYKPRTPRYRALTFEQNHLRRHRRLGYLARMKTREGRKIVLRKSLKGRRYLAL